MRICELTALEADDLDRRGIRPDCHRHGHLVKTAARELVVTGSARWVGSKQKAVTASKRSNASTRLATGRGYDIASNLEEAKTPRLVRGVIQLVSGVLGGRQGHLHYEIPMCGARTRTMRVAEINKPR
jgi:hypothetical protein